MSRAKRLLLLALAMLLTGFAPSPDHSIDVNGCGGGVIGYQNGVTYAFTAAHCVSGTPGPTISVDGGILNGRLVYTKGDLAYITYHIDHPPAHILPVATSLPKAGERIWMITSNYYTGEFLPVPAVWLNVSSTFQDKFTIWTVWGGSVRGFSGSPVLNERGELLGVVSIGYFIDLNFTDTIPYAPWTGITLLPGLAP